MVVVTCDDCSVGKCRHKVCCKYSCHVCKKYGNWKKDDDKKDDKKGGK